MSFSRTPQRRAIAVTVALAAALALASCSGSRSQDGGTGGRGASKGPIIVGYVVVQQGSAPIIQDLPGRVSAFQSSDVRPQVSGVILRRLFTEGAIVHQGQTLYIDLFGRLRSLTQAQFQQYLATEAGARATRLSLVGDIARAWLDYAADSSLLAVSQQTVTTAQASVRLSRIRLEGGIAPRTDLSQAQEILSQAQAGLASQHALVAQDVNALQLLVGSPIAPSLLPSSIAQAAATIAPVPAGLDSDVLLRRPDVLQAEYQLRAANANIGAARAALFPKITLTGLLGFASAALTSLFSSFGWQVGANAAYTIFQAGAGHANVRLTEAQRNAALAKYQLTVQTAFREVSDALARRATMDEQLAATQRQQAAAADVVLLTEARYRAGIDPFLTVLDAQRSYYAVQQTLVNTRRTAAHNRVDLYQALGGDSLLQAAPLCNVAYVSSANSAKLASQCSPM